MKLALIISLIVGCLSKSVSVAVYGKLTCSKNFTYTAKLWEEDKYIHNFIYQDKSDVPAEVGYYNVYGNAFDGWFESEVEPFISVEHTCGSEKACICHFFAGTSDSLNAELDIDLEHHNFKWCNGCSQEH